MFSYACPADHICPLKADDVWALGITLHLAAFSCFPNGTFEAQYLHNMNFESNTSNQILCILTGGKVRITLSFVCCQALPILLRDFVAPEGTDPQLAAVLEGLMKVHA